MKGKQEAEGGMQNCGFSSRHTEGLFLEIWKTGCVGGWGGDCSGDGRVREFDSDNLNLRGFWIFQVGIPVDIKIWVSKKI